MKQPRRKAAWMAAFLLAASLTALPREGAAWPPYIDIDPGGPTEGEPDGPPNAPAYVIREQRTWSLSLTLIHGRILVLVEPARLAGIASRRPSKPPTLRSR